jgi:hypothetical protein
MTPAKVFLFLSEMVGRPAIRGGSPTAPAGRADQLDDVADLWNCWRLRSETTREHRHRLQLHLHTLALAIEDDLAVLDDLDHVALGPEHDVR